MSSFAAALVLLSAGTLVADGEERRTLSVTATVTESCAVTTAGREAIACTSGTRWTSASTAPAAPPVRANAATQQTTTRGGVSYLTITY